MDRPEEILFSMAAVHHSFMILKFPSNKDEYAYHVSKLSKSFDFYKSVSDNVNENDIDGSICSFRDETLSISIKPIKPKRSTEFLIEITVKKFHVIISYDCVTLIDKTFDPRMLADSAKAMLKIDKTDIDLLLNRENDTTFPDVLRKYIPDNSFCSKLYLSLIDIPFENRCHKYLSYLRHKRILCPLCDRPKTRTKCQICYSSIHSNEKCDFNIKSFCVICQEKHSIGVCCRFPLKQLFLNNPKKITSYIIRKV